MSCVHQREKQPLGCFDSRNNNKIIIIMIFIQILDIYLLNLILGFSQTTASPWVVLVWPWLSGRTPSFFTTSPSWPPCCFTPSPPSPCTWSGGASSPAALTFLTSVSVTPSSCQSCSTPSGRVSTSCWLRLSSPPTSKVTRRLCSLSGPWTASSFNVVFSR